MTVHHPHRAILALDVGEKRVGVAIASLAARLAHPLKTLEQGEHIFEELQTLVHDEHVGQVIVGLPRNLSGHATAQTIATEVFVAELKRAIGVPVHWQDEAVTSVQAEDELRTRGKPYTKADIDALSATYILEDYLRDNPGVPI